jgi:hypothetical protein
MRVRRFELRLVGVALVASWTVAAALILLAYRPGGPLDELVGLTMLVPIAVALAGLIWPPVTRGENAFAGMIWLGIAALLVLVPSVAGLLEQLQALGSQTLLPSFEAAYPWLLAIAATSLFSGLGIARRWRGAAAIRRRRFIDGALIGVGLTALSATLFAGAAVANDVAIRDQVAAVSRFGPTAVEDPPPACDGFVRAGTSATLRADFSGKIDGRPIGSITLSGQRSEGDVRWSAYVATDQRLGLAGAARVGDSAWLRQPGGAWASVSTARLSTLTIDVQVLAAALTSGDRKTAEDHGIEVIEGARARRCRVAVDGAAFQEAFPEVQWLVGDADLRRWRGQIDYWIFQDGELGQVAADAGGEAGGIDPTAIHASIGIHLTATERDRDIVVYPPG